MTITSIDFNQNRPTDEISVPLDGSVYNLTFTYSQLDDSWFMDIDETVYGIKLVNGIDLLELYRYLNVPPGELRCVRRAGRKSKPSFNDIGTNKEIELVYITNA